jgi:hypothetical protein
LLEINYVHNRIGGGVSGMCANVNSIALYASSSMVLIGNSGLAGNAAAEAACGCPNGNGACEGAREVD